MQLPNIEIYILQRQARCSVINFPTIFLLPLYVFCVLHNPLKYCPRRSCFVNIEGTMCSCRQLLLEVYDKMNCDDFRILTFLAKDRVNRKRRKENENILDFFDLLERKAIIKCGPEEIDLWFLKQAFLLIGRNDLVSTLVRVGRGPRKQPEEGLFVNIRRYVGGLIACLFFASIFR